MIDFRYRGGPPPFSFETVCLECHDPVRDRMIPVKIHFPKPLPSACPVILFSHCLGGSREGYGFLARHWACHGYISVHPQHAGSDQAIWERVPAGHVMAALRAAAMDAANAPARVGDVAFVLDQLALAADETGICPWACAMDLTRLGVAGHSFGAMTALTLAGRGFAREGEPPMVDPRFKAALAMSSPIPKTLEKRELEFGSIAIPALHMSGTEDEIPISTTRAEERRAPFDHARRAPSYFLNFQGGDHMVFAGMTRNAARRETDAFIHEIIQESSLALWDAFLKDDAVARQWLEQGGLTSRLNGQGTLEIKLPSPTAGGTADK
jgi:hypothetical protein